jgi:hypothetical protein
VSAAAQAHESRLVPMALRNVTIAGFVAACARFAFQQNHSVMRRVLTILAS